MRRFPSSWDKTLTALGMKRSRKRSRSCNRRRLGAGVENLETRVLLASDFVYSITSTDDVAILGSSTDNVWSLREAIAHSVADGPSNDRIEFASNLAGQTIDLNSQISIDSNIIIDGSAAPGLTVSGNDVTRLFKIERDAIVTFQDLVLANGFSSSGGHDGGAIHSFGELTVDRVDFIDNVVPDLGGAIYAQEGSLSVKDSEFVDNQGKGGAIWIYQYAVTTVDIDRSTFVGNVSTVGGGAIGANGNKTSGNYIRISNSTFYDNESRYAGGAIGVSGVNSLEITNSTIVENESTQSYGGGIATWNSTPTLLQNTIVSTNTSSTHSSNLYANSSNSSNWANNHIGGADPKLAPLGYYGGATRTMPPLPSSPVIDAGGSSAITDQRGFSRDVDVPWIGSGNTIDIGAIESSVNALPIFSISEGQDPRLTENGVFLPEMSPLLSFSWDLDGDEIADPANTWNDLLLSGITNDGSYTIALLIDDGHDIEQLFTTLNVSNIAPVASDATTFITEDGLAEEILFSNVVEPVDTLAITSISTPGFPNGVLYGDNSTSYYNFTPGEAYDALREGEQVELYLDYTVSDGAESDMARWTVVITGTNDAPTLSKAGTVPISEGGFIKLWESVDLSDAEDNDSQLSFEVQNVVAGEFQDNQQIGVALQENVTYSNVVFGGTNFFHDGSEAPPSFEIRTVDSDGLAGDWVLVTPAYTPINDAPTTSEIGTVPLSEGSFLKLWESVSNSDAEDNDSQLSFEVRNVVAGEFQDNQQIGVALQENVTYSNVVFGGTNYFHDGSETPPSFEIRTVDSHGLTGDWVLVTPTFSPINDAPTLSQIGTVPINEGGFIKLWESVGLSDAEDNDSQLSFKVRNIVAGEFQDNQQIGVALQENVTYSNAVFEGTNFFHDGSETPPSFEIQAVDSDGLASGWQLVTPAFTAVNDAPTISQVGMVPITEGGFIKLWESVGLSDAEDNDSLVSFEVRNVIAGEFQDNQQIGVVLQENVTYSAAVFGGTNLFHDGSEIAPSFEIQAVDSNGLASGWLLVTPAFTAVNDAPTISQVGTVPITEGGFIKLWESVGLSDAEDNDSLVSFEVRNIVAGEFQDNQQIGIALQENVTYSGAVFEGTNFFHEGSENAPSFEIQAVDIDGLTSEWITVIPSFTQVNDAPIALSSRVTTTEDALYTFSVSDFKTYDPEGDLFASITVSNLSLNGGTLQLSGVDIIEGQIILASDLGQLIYTPLQNANGTDYAQFSFTANDAQDNGTVGEFMSIDVTPINDLITVTPTSFSVEEDTNYLIGDVSTGDSTTSGGSLTYTLTGTPSGNDGFAFNSDGTFLFFPSENFNGTTYFAYTVTDIDSSESFSLIATINVTPVADMAITAFNTVEVSLARRDLEVSYYVNDVANPTIEIWHSVDGANIDVVNDQPLMTRSFAELGISLGTGTAQFQADFSSIPDGDYKLVARIVSGSGSSTGTTQRFFGGIFDDASGNLHVHGTTKDDYLLTIGDDNASIISDDAPIVDSIASSTGNYNAAYVYGHEGSDFVLSSASSIPITIYGGSGDDSLFGGDGNDYLDGGAGNDFLSGGEGDDVYAYSGGGVLGHDILNENAGQGSDTIDFSQFANEGTSGVYFTLPEIDETRTVTINLYHTIEIADSEFENLVGTEFDDTLYGNALNNHLTGGSGDDVIIAKAGDDYLDGGTGGDVLGGDAGADIIVGQTGDDLIRGGNDRDLLIGGEGTDTIYGEGGEDIVIGGTTLYDSRFSQLQAILEKWDPADGEYLFNDPSASGVSTGVIDSNGNKSLQFPADYAVWLNSHDIDALPATATSFRVQLSINVDSLPDPTAAGGPADAHRKGVFTIVDRQSGNGGDNFKYMGVVYLSKDHPLTVGGSVNATVSGYYVINGQYTADAADPWDFENAARKALRVEGVNPRPVIETHADFGTRSVMSLFGQIYEYSDANNLPTGLRFNASVGSLTTYPPARKDWGGSSAPFVPDRGFGLYSSSGTGSTNAFVVYQQAANTDNDDTISRITIDPIIDIQGATATSDAFFDRIDFVRGSYNESRTILDEAHLRVTRTVFDDDVGDTLYGGDGTVAIDKAMQDWIFREAIDSLPDGFTQEQLEARVIDGGENLSRGPEDNADRLDYVSSTDIQKRVADWLVIGNPAIVSNSTRSIPSSLGLSDNGWTGLVENYVEGVIEKGVRKYQLHNLMGVWDYANDTVSRPPWMTVDQFQKAMGTDLYRGVGGEAGRGGYDISIGQDGQANIELLRPDLSDNGTDPVLAARDVNNPQFLSYLTNDFVTAWKPVTNGDFTSGEKVEVIAYVGSMKIAETTYVDITTPTAKELELGITKRVRTLQTGDSEFDNTNGKAQLLEGGSDQYVQVINSLHPGRQDQAGSATDYMRIKTGNSNFTFGATPQEVEDALYSLYKQVLDANLQPYYDAGMSVAFDAATNMTPDSFAFRYLDELRTMTYSEVSPIHQATNTQYIKFYVEAIPKQTADDTNPIDSSYWYLPPTDQISGQVNGSALGAQILEGTYFSWEVDNLGKSDDWIIDPELWEGGYVRLAQGGDDYNSGLGSADFLSDPINTTVNNLASGQIIATRFHNLLEDVIGNSRDSDWIGSGDWFDDLSDFT